MKIYLLFITLSFSLFGFAQYTAIPDSNFENALSTYDDIPNDGQVPTANINTITSLDVSDENISSLAGIEDFVALTDLDCSENQLTTLDISQNVALEELTCYINQLTALDVSGSLALTSLYCSENQLTVLDVSGNLALTSLFCEVNLLSILDLSQNTNLIGLGCGGSLLTNLVLNQNINLYYFGFALSPLITNLDISQHTNLQNLEYLSNSLISVNLNQNINLEHLTIEDCNSLENILLTNNTNLKDVSCKNNNSLTGFSIKNGNNTNITYYPTGDFVGYSFFVQNNPNLTCIEVDDASWSTTNWTYVDSWASFSEECYLNDTYVPDDNFENYLETHDASGTVVPLGDPTSMGNGIANDDYVTTANINTVINLDISNQNILDLTGIADFTALKYLNCYSNQLINIDVSQNSALISMICQGNQITSLDLSQNLLIETVDCRSNQITDLDLSLNPNLNSLNCNNNLLTSLNVKNGNNTNLPGYNFLSQNNPNLTCIIVDNATYSTANWANIDATSTFVNNQAECSALSIDSYQNNIFSFYPNPVNNYLNITIHQNAIYSFYTLEGQLLQKGKLENGINKLNLEQYSNGVYFIKVQTDNLISTKKLIIN